MRLYISQNSTIISGNTLTPGWGWEVKSASYDSNTGVTDISLELGYDGQQFSHTETVGGNFGANPEDAILAEPDYLDSTGPIGSGGWPPPPGL